MTASTLGSYSYYVPSMRPAPYGHVRQRGGNCGVVEVAADHAATVEIWVGKPSIIGGVSSAIASVCM
jgi:hypothetical protein